MDEEKRQEHPSSKGDFLETVEPTGNKPMSAETNLPNGEVKPEETPVTQAEKSEEFTLEPEVEPFDLNPESSTAAEIASWQAKVEELTQQIESLKAQVEDRNGQYMRLAADFENYRKRTQKEKEDQEQQVKGSTLKELLPVVDNFERARSQIKPQTDAENTIHNSYQGVYKDLVNRLKKIGVAPMRSEGKPFDPSMHEAVMREETDAQPEGTVLEELQRGYVLGEQVLRHAMVKVAAAPEGESTEEDNASS
ncbi:MAG TPA: nucleotide exchange factor GrpE [Allocoleopsis sp.]